MPLENVKKISQDYISSLGYERISELFCEIPSGKQLRSKLILSIAKTSKDAPKLAAIVEMIHAASLLHDDVIDESKTRRGEASFNSKYGDKNAIMLGDILYSCGFSKLSLLDSNVATCVANSVALLAAGELSDVELSANMNTDLEKYYKMIYAKTASLIESSAKAAALLEGLDSDDFALYGKNLGLAFQIIDDVLDIISDEETLGKPSMSDFTEGKMTLPYLHLYEKCNNEEKEYFKTLFKKQLLCDDLLWIKDKLAKYDIIKKCVNEAKKLGLEALSVIKKYNNESLEKVIVQMIDRDF